MTVLAAEAGGMPVFFPQAAAMVVFAAAIGYLFVRLRIVPIIGFLLAGTLIGPSVLGLVTEREAVDAVAEVGVVLLLFTIGIEFSLARLGQIKRLVLLGGGLQVLSAVGVTAALLLAFGVTPGAAVFTGFLVALSSTAIVLKLLADRIETNTPTGQTALAFLIFQDLAVVGMVLVLPQLGGAGGSMWELVRALGTALAVIAVVLVVARRVMPRLLEAVARACSPEVFLLTVVAICLGTAFVSAMAGVSLSLGAFLAGLLVSESRQSTQALGEVLPLQILFAAAFFVSVGTLLDVGFLLRQPGLIAAALALVVLVVKIVTTGVSALVVGAGGATAASSALLLAQVGEFSFVLERAGRAVGLSPAGLGEDGVQAFIAATVLLMVVTPGLAALGRRLGARLGARSARRTRAATPDLPLPSDGQRDHVLISGWGEGARHLAADLAGAGVPLIVTTLNPDGASEAVDAGHDVLLGDSTKRHTLEEAGVRQARIVVIADDEPETAARIAALTSQLAPAATVVVRTAEALGLDELVAAGVHKVVSGDRASLLGLSKAVLGELVERPGTHTIVDTSRVVRFRADPDMACPHVSEITPVLPSAHGCEDCLRIGADWVHLRICLRCGHVGCCDSSPNRHASAHARNTGHPVICSAEPGEDWAYCYRDQTTMAPRTRQRLLRRGDLNDDPVALRRRR
jgi:CPA2 family monovalent cation:H+ antiporter-2